MTELETFLESKTNLTASSVKNYRSVYNRIKQLLSTDISKTEEDTLIDVVNLIEKINSKVTIINLMIMIRSHFDLSIKKLDKYRDKLFEERDKYTSQKLTEKNLELPSYQVIDQYIKTLESNRYIVNYLTFYYAFRNKDVNLFLTNRKLTKNINTETNYLIVKKTEIELIINDYKTIKNYLQKRIVIRNKHFVEVCNVLPLSTYLLTGDENPISPSSLHNTITRILYKYNDKHLTEADYFKILVKEKKSNLNELKKISEFRGTSLDTIIQYYHLN